MEEGTLTKWHIKAGDTVSAGQVIAEIETDKATMEVEAVDEGVVQEILVSEGSEGVKVNTPIARLKDEGGAASPKADKPAGPSTSDKPAQAGHESGQAVATPEGVKSAEAVLPPKSAPAPKSESGQRIFASPLARNFLGGVSLNDRLFTLFVFVHLGVPILIVFGLWFHIQRISYARVFPPRAMALGTTATLLVLALVLPVQSQGPANLAAVPQSLQLDWILLFIHPLTASTSAITVWVLLIAAFAGLVALPLLPTRKPPVAQVDPDNCSGCRRCFDDCPYSAITMVPHPNGRRGMQMAEVNADLCASCGICVGSCPSSTPFRSAERLLTGIDMPQWPIHALRERLLQGLAAMPGPRRLVVFGCDHGVRTGSLAAPDVLHFGLVCAGMLPPSFIEYALRGGADGVLVSGCREGGCEFRLGQRWTLQRLSGEREPHLRATVPQDRLRVVWADRGDEIALGAALDQLRACTRAPVPPLPLESCP